MKKFDEIATQTSCLNKASDDEPIFVLRANDELAPQVVRAWAERYRARKIFLESWGPKQMRKYDEAVALAFQMEKWKEQHGA